MNNGRVGLSGAEGMVGGCFTKEAMFASSQRACLLFTTCGNKNEVFLSRDTCLEVENLLKMSTEIGGIIRNPLFFER